MAIPRELEQSIANITKILDNTKNPKAVVIKRIIEKAKKKKGLSLKEVGYLVNLKNPDIIKDVFRVATEIKRQIYGERLVFFAPLYVSDYCVNDCEYCNFHRRNTKLKRRRLTLKEVKEQAGFLINQGHKRTLLEFGEDPIQNNIDYVTDVIKKIYSVHTPKGNIRRVNVNIAATTVENYRRLKQAHIGTYQLFQETYHRPTYEKLHNGPKADYERQITAHCQAFKGGLDDIGIGVLFGLYNWRYEVLGLVAHAQYLDKTYEIGPHTISVPRICPAPSVTYQPQYQVSDKDFLKLIAILRLAVPYTGMIISTRESPKIREIAFRIGISQASAGSVTTTGGYGKMVKHSSRHSSGLRFAPQFTIHDERSLQEVIKEVIKDKLVPSFCTACYRTGRTGERFMGFAKLGKIHKFCRPNALLTFAEYLNDFATDGLKETGKPLIQHYLNQIEDKPIREEIMRRLALITSGKRDIYF